MASGTDRRSVATAGSPGATEFPVLAGALGRHRERSPVAPGRHRRYRAETTPGEVLVVGVGERVGWRVSGTARAILLPFGDHRGRTPAAVCDNPSVADQRRELLVDTTPLPEGLDLRLRQQLTFLIEIDRLKTVLRQSPLASAPRRENDAEHSWHLAMMVVLLAPYADEQIDVGHTVELVLVHDLVEIYAGDTPLYDTGAGQDQLDRERLAADTLFGLLPEDQAAWIRALWDEFEERKTPEARFAKAMDRLQPLLLNWMARGGTWRTPGVTVEDVRQRKAVIGDASARLWEAGQHLINEGAARGWARPAPGRPA